MGELLATGPKVKLGLPVPPAAVLGSLTQGSGSAGAKNRILGLKSLVLTKRL